jgi:ethanolamine ammonia-lyase small subunit
MNDPWGTLRQFTPARIAQGRAGHGARTASLLDFQLAHASARDAVHLPWDVDAFAQGVEALGLEAITLSTRVTDRMQYLKRPDLGRVLDPPSRERLAAWSGPSPDIALIFSNGLSSTAIETHGLCLLQAVIGAYRGRVLPAGQGEQNGDFEARPILTIAPICLVPDARVALSDEVGALLRARLSVIVVGERPGLSAADSLGIYMTYNPNPANTDAERNCISNIHPPEGMGYRAAAMKLLYLSEQALRRRLSGVALKDDMPNVERLEADGV